MFSSIPIASPTTVAIQNDVKRANSAAVSAGTTWSGSDVESSWVIEAASTPSPPAIDRREHGVRERQLVRREAEQHRADLVLRRGPRREPEAAELEQQRERERDADDDRRQDEAVDRHDRAEQLDGVAREHRRLRLGVDPERERDSRLCDEQHAERRCELRERRGGSQRPERDELDQHAERHEEQERQDQRRGRRRVPAVFAGLERPVRVAAEHRDRTRREIDEPRAAIGQDDPEGDPGDQCAGAEPEDREEEELVPVHALRVSTKTGRGPTFGPRPSSASCPSPEA